MKKICKALSLTTEDPGSSTRRGRTGGEDSGTDTPLLPVRPGHTSSIHASLLRPRKLTDDSVKKKLLEAKLSINRIELQLLQLNTKLLEAVENGEIDNISRLLHRGANPNATCQLNDVSACHLAAVTDKDSLSLLIKSGADASRADRLGRTPLHLAAWAGRPKQIAVLLDLPTDLQNKITNSITIEIETEVKKLVAVKKDLINKACHVADSATPLPKEWKDSIAHDCKSTNKNLPEFQAGWTALHCASSRAQYACVRLLLAAGADPNSYDDDQRTPVDVAGEAFYMGATIDVQEFIEIIKLLITMGGQMNNASRDVRRVNTPLHTAVELESVMAVRELLDLGASAACLNSRGLSPMHLCVEKWLAQLLELLANYDYIDQDPMVDVMDTNGLTVLNAAIRARWHRGARILLCAGADVTIQAYDGNAPIHAAATMGQANILRFILAIALCAIDIQNKLGYTALFLAIYHNHIETVKLLVENDACFEITEPYRINVLHVAAREGHVEILKILLNCIDGAKEHLVNQICNFDCYPPIVYAVIKNNPLCVKLLLEKHAQIRIEVPCEHEITKKQIWTTPIHIAAAENYYEIAKSMIDSDDSIINLRNTTGFLPLHEACCKGNKEIITLLIRNGADLSVESRKRYNTIDDATEHGIRTPIQMIMDHVPNPTDYMEEVFDHFISSNGQCVTSQITVNYKVLQPNCIDGKQMNVINALLNTGNAHDQKKLLQHPLIESFIYLKWKSLLPFFYKTLVLYSLFVISLNVHLVSVFFYEDKNNLMNITNDAILIGNLYPSKPVPRYFQSYIWLYMLYITVSFLVIQELINLKLRNKKYYRKLETWVKYGVIGLAIFLPSVVTWRTPEDVIVSRCTPEWVRFLTTTAVFLSWVEMMYLLARFPSCGHYALMLGNVTTKVFKVLLTFGVLIFGFSLCFLIQFRAKQPFEGLWATLTKTLVMMTSEFDYMSTINKQHAIGINASIVILRIIFITFVVFASIVLMNILVGVAVNDVSYLEKIGTRNRLTKQVEFLTSLEDILCHDVINKKLPKNVLRVVRFLNQRVDSEIVLKPSDPNCKYSNILPRYLKEAIYEKAQMQVKHNGRDSMVYEKKLDKIQHDITKHDEKLEKLFKLLINNKILSVNDKEA